MTQAMSAYTSQAPKRRLLRVGRVHDGRIVEERHFGEGASITAGNKEGNDFVLQEATAPASCVLFAPEGDDVRLVIPEGWTGRVTLGGQVTVIHAEGLGGAAQSHGRSILLSQNSRGLLQLGATTFLFQFVVPPPPRNPPQLPAATRKSYLGGIDWMFASVCLLTYGCLFGFVVTLDATDWPVSDAITEIPFEYRFVFEPPASPPAAAIVEPDSRATETSAAAAPKNQESHTERTPVAGTSTLRPTSVPGPRTVDSARIRDSARNMAESLLLTSLGNGAGALADVLSQAPLIGRSEEVLAQAQGVGVARTATPRMREQNMEMGSGVSDAIVTLRRAGDGSERQAQREGEAREERVIRGQAQIGTGASVAGGYLDDEVVARMIRSRRGAFRRCYEQTLNSHGQDTAGRVAIQFTIQPAGNVSGVRVAENTTQAGGLGQCLTRVIGSLRWRQGPEDGPATFNYPFIFTPQN